MWWNRLSELGLALAAITPAEPDFELAALLQRRRLQGLYPPFASTDPRLRSDPCRFWPAARTIISVAVTYPGGTVQPPPGLFGLVARSMRGRDYHYLVRKRLEALASLLVQEGAGDFQWQVWVDSVPPVERALARRADLGFIGKNCCLISPGLGSWFWLGELVLDRELPEALRPPRPTGANAGCGSCSRCLEACPTGALQAPYVLNPQRCLSFITQSRGPIPHEYRTLLGQRLFGCDTCQEACPYNQPLTGKETGQLAWLPLEALLEGSRQHFLAGTTLAWRRGSVLARNAAVVLGNSGRPEALKPLQAALNHPSPLVRGHAAWALGCLGSRQAARALETILTLESDAGVIREVRAALASIKEKGWL